MNITRSQAIFALIIVAAIVLVGGTALVNSLGSGDDDTTNSGSAFMGDTPGDSTGQDAPPTGTADVIVQSSNTKELWMDEMARQFNALNQRTSTGERVQVTVHHTGQELQTDLTPAAWSPANQPWIDSVNQDNQDLYGFPLISDACPPTVAIPLGIAMWQPMAEALGWPNTPIGWADIAALAQNPDGWAAYGHPEWGRFKYGHGHPEHSNSGRLSIVAEIYAANGETSVLTLADVENTDAEASVAAVQQAVAHYGEVDTDLLDRMVLRGPSYLHAVTNYEGNVVRWNNERAADMQFPFVMVYPSEGVFLIDHPFCVLDRAQWVSAAQIEGAQMFRDFITQRDQQAQLVQFGIRPADTSIPLAAPLDLAHGVNPNLVPGQNINVLPYPPANVMDAVVSLWKRVKKPSTVVLTIDTSGSMRGEALQALIMGAQRFVRQMQPNDEIVVFTFGDTVTRLEPSGLVGEVGEELAARIGTLFAEGNTALFEATLQSYEVIEGLRAEDLAADEARIYGIVLMSDGQNTSGQLDEKYVRRRLPDGSESDQVRLYTIAYGDEADEETLRLWANRTNGKFFQGSIEDIENIYFLISSEF